MAFVPGRAAFVDGRGGSAMRLNFSGVSEDEIREGVRRIGEVVREQVAMYGTLTGVRPLSARPALRAMRRHASADRADAVTYCRVVEALPAVVPSSSPLQR